MFLSKGICLSHALSLTQLQCDECQLHCCSWWQCSLPPVIDSSYWLQSSLLLHQLHCTAEACWWEKVLPWVQANELCRDGYFVCPGNCKKPGSPQTAVRSLSKRWMLLLWVDAAVWPCALGSMDGQWDLTVHEGTCLAPEPSTFCLFSASVLPDLSR